MNSLQGAHFADARSFMLGVDVDSILGAQLLNSCKILMTQAAMSLACSVSLVGFSCKWYTPFFTTPLSTQLPCASSTVQPLAVRTPLDYQRP